MKNAVVVGATGGIASGLVKALEQEGYKVISVARSTGMKCDLTDLKQIANAAEEIKKEINTLDLLINAAGVATYKNLEEVSDKEMQEAFMVNVMAPAIFIRELLPLMDPDESLVMSLGSGAGTIPMRGRSIYCSTKYALRGLSLSLNEEFEGKNPKFCLITLGSTITNFGPMTAKEKEEQAAKGKAYFPVNFVVDKLIEIIKDPNRENEITLFPSEHGFGTWKKP